MYKLTELNGYNLEKFKKIITTISHDAIHHLKDKLDDQYYNKGIQELSDEKYDAIVDYLKMSEDFIHTVGCKIKDGDNKVALPFHLNSMEKIKQGELKKLDKWYVTKASTDSFVVSDKLNGVSCLICYSDLGIINLFTRGDGIIGSDISYIKDLIKGIPVGLKNMAVRGELIVEKSIFDSEYASDYKNSLGMLVSVVNSKSLKKPMKDIRFVAYEIVTNKPANTPKDNLNYLKKCGFEVVQYTVTETLKDSELSTYLTKRMEESVYSIDGIIVHTNKPYDRLDVEASGNPKYAFAYKMITDSCETEVVDVIWTASRHSLLKPRIQIKPVTLCGATINFVTGNNAKFIRDNYINKGSRLLVIRSGEIIPKIEQVLTHSEFPLLPTVNYKWTDTMVDIILVEGDSVDEDVTVKRLSYFFSTVGCKQIAEGVVRKLVRAGFNEIFKILDMEVADFKTIPTFEDKMSNRLYDNIRQLLSEPIDVATLMVASCIFGHGLGIKKLKVLLKEIPDLLTRDISGLSASDILKVDGFGHKTVSNIIENIDRFKEFLNQYKKYCLDAESETEIEIIDDNIFTEEEINMAKGKSQRLKEEVIVFTNFRDYAIEDKLISLGAEIGDSVTKKTTCLVVPDDYKKETSKVAKAKQYGTKILEVSVFVKEYEI